MHRFTTHRIVPLLAVSLMLLALPVHAQDGNPFFTDSDGDGRVDGLDACPQDAGPAANDGCPEGTTPPDTDADGTPDLYDRCPQDAGPAATEDTPALDCPDTDGDGTPDRFDLCPDEPAGLGGCPLIRETTLPGRVTLTPATAPGLLLLGGVVLPTRDIEINAPGTLTVQDPAGIITPYNLSDNPLVPTLAADVTGIVHTRTTLDPTENFPILSVHKLSTQRTFTLAFPDFDGVTTAISADGERIAAAQTVSALAERLAESVVEVYATDGELLSSFTVPGTAQAMTFGAPDTLWVLVQDELLQVDIVSGAVLDSAELEGRPLAVFGGDTLAYDPVTEHVAIGFGQGGAVTVFPANPLGRPLYDRATANTCPNDTVTHLRFSPDGSLLAVATDCFMEGFTQPPGTARWQVTLLDAATGEPLTTVAPTQPPRDIAFTPGGDMLVLGTTTSVQFWGVLPPAE